MQSKETVFNWIENNKSLAISYLSELVIIPSVNPWFTDYDPYTTEKDFQQFIAAGLRDMGFDVDLWEIDSCGLRKFEGMPGYYEGRPMKDRPNLCGVLKGTGGGRSILLTGHADVVKAGDGWTKPPFGAVIENGKLYGRGSVDMKGGIAAMIMAVKAIRESGFFLKGDVLVAAVPDEEAGGMGTLDFVHRGYKADGAIMTEPTALQIGPMCRGILWGKIVIPARAGHIEMYQGHWRSGGAVDGVRLVQLFLAQIDQFNRNWAAKKTHKLLPMPCQLIVAEIHAGEYPSAYAGSAELTFNAQYLPTELDEMHRGSKVKKEIEDFIASVAQTDEWMRENPPHVEWLLDADCAETSDDCDFVKSIISSAENAGRKCDVVGIGCHTDMGWYVNSGIPTVNFGPGNPKIAHQPDEYIELDEFIQCIKIMASMIMDWCEVQQ